MATTASLMSREPSEGRHERTKRVLVVHRFPIVRCGVIKLIEAHIVDVVVDEAATVSLGLQRVREASWDLVAVGFSFGDRSGIELVKGIKALRPNVPVLVFSTHSEEAYAHRSFDAGAAGYVTLDSSREEVVRALQTVLSGAKYVSPRVGAMLRSLDSRRALSDREYEVMRLLASGRTVSEIASLLSLSVRTIRTSRTRVVHKLAMQMPGDAR